MGRWISHKKISYTNGGIILHKWMWILFNPYMGRWIKHISILIALGCFNPYMGRWLNEKCQQPY
jgi:hypothetical protein